LSPGLKYLTELWVRKASGTRFPTYWSCTLSSAGWPTNPQRPLSCGAWRHLSGRKAPRICSLFRART